MGDAPHRPGRPVSEATDRPQDAGRRHRRTGNPSPETRLLLGRYQGAMRAELEALLAEIAPRPPEPGLGLVQDAPKRPPIRDRIALWDLAIKLGRELGAEIDPPADDDDAEGPAPAPRSRRRRVDFG